jgi:hypothetical protein
MGYVYINNVATLGVFEVMEDKVKVDLSLLAEITERNT